MKKISKITICLTNICDMHCDYCYRYEDSIIAKPNKFEYWQDLLLYIMNTKDFDFDDNLAIHFTGGEPSLYFYDILEGIFTLRTLNKLKNIQTKFGMITNLFSPNDLLTLLENKYMTPEDISISYDYTGDYKDQYQIICLSELIHYHGYNMKTKYYDICVKMAITKKTIPYLYEAYKHLRSLNYTNIGYYFVNGTNDYDDEKIREEFRQQLQKIKDYCDISNIYIQNYNEFIHEKNNPFCTKLGELLYIDTEGTIWPCAFLSDDSKVHGIKDIEKYKIGNIFTGINKDRLYISESNSTEWLDRFCPACSNECKEKIRAMKQIEIDVFTNGKGLK